MRKKNDNSTSISNGVMIVYKHVITGQIRCVMSERWCAILFLYDFMC